MERVRRGPQYRSGGRRRSLRLTPRELEVARYLSDGLSTDDIADALHLSFHTVKKHVAAILMRTGTKTRCHAVATLLRDGDLD